MGLYMNMKYKKEAKSLNFLEGFRSQPRIYKPEESEGNLLPEGSLSTQAGVYPKATF